jgi:hypothetical protein
MELASSDKNMKYDTLGSQNPPSIVAGEKPHMRRIASATSDKRGSKMNTRDVHRRGNSNPRPVKN